MAFTIYTISDPATIGSVLTSMAMFFGQDSWVGSMIKTGLIIALLFILGKGVVANGGLRLDTMLIQLIIVWVAFMPKTTVTVEHFENAAPARVVDDVPFAIAVPSAMAGSFALFVTQKIEVVMSSANPKFISASGETEVFAPAKTLMAIVGCAHDPDRCMDENWKQTLFAASRYCGGGEMSNKDFNRSPSVFRAFAEGLTQNNQTIIYTTDNPYNPGGSGGQAATCEEVRQYINNVATDLEANNESVFEKVLDGIAKNTQQNKYQQWANAQPSTREWPETLEIINHVTNDSAQINNVAITNVMAFSMAEQFARAGKTSFDTIVEVKRDTGLFEWAKAEADSAFMVTTASPKFMDILFFIYIAATPIVMFVAIANPESGIKVVGGYLLFGLWTQSWVPMMSIITGWYQNQLLNFPLPGPLGFTPEYMAGYLRHIYSTTIVASNMLQASPYMMFAIMSGSMFALSNMISKAAPSVGAGSVAEGASPSSGGGKPSSGVPNAAGLGNGPSGAAQLASVQGGLGALSGGLGSSSFAGGGNVQAAMGGVLPNVSAAGGAQLSTAAASAKVAETSQTASQAAEKAWQQLFSIAKSGSTGVSSASVASALRSEGYTVANQASDTTRDSTGKSTTFGVGQTTTQNSQFGANASASVSSRGLFDAIGSVLQKEMDGVSKEPGAAAKKGSLGNLSALFGQAEKAMSGGDTAKGNALLDQFKNAAARHDANFGSASNSVLGKVGGIIGKALNLEAGVTASADRKNSQATNLKSEEGGSNERAISTGKTITTSNGATNTVGTEGRRSAELKKSAQEAESSTQSAKEAFQTAQTARDAQSLTRTATTSSGMNSNSSIDGAALVAAWGNSQANSQGVSATSKQAESRILSAIGNALGNLGGDFQASMAANEKRLRDEHKGLVMNNDQIAAAAALQSLNGMMQSGNQTAAATGFAAIAQLAENSGMGGGLNSQALVKAAQLLNEVDGKIQKNADELAPGAAATGNKVDAGMQNADALRTRATEFNNNAEAGAEGGFGAAKGSFGSATPQGDALKNDVLASKPEVQEARNPHGYDQPYQNATGNTSLIPESGDASTFVSGNYNPTFLKESAVALGGAYQMAENSINGGVQEGRQVSADVAVPISGSLAAGEEVVSSTAKDASSAVQAGAATASGSGSSLPTLGGGPGIQLAGGQGAGSGTPITPQGNQQASSKPNSSVPSSQGKGSAPIQGR